MRGRKCLLLSLTITAALLGASVPTGAEPAALPVERAPAGERWGPLIPVPVTDNRVVIEAAAISDRGHIAVAYWAYSRGSDPRSRPAYVIVRGPGGRWTAPHRLNPPLSVVKSVDLGFDARGNLTAFWSSMTNIECCSDDAPPPESTYIVATRPVHRRWTTHLPVGPVQRDDFAQDGVLSVAPSGRAVIGWRQYQESSGEFQFTVRVRPAADAAWGPAQALSAVSNRRVTGDVATNDHGTAVAAWQAARPWPAETGSVQRSTLTRSGTWTAPVTIGRNTDNGGGVAVASTPAGFTAITWMHRYGRRYQTVLALRSAAGIWTRDHVIGPHDRVAVGPHRSVVIHNGTQIRWRTRRSDWSETWLAPKRTATTVFAPAVDSTGRIFVPWSEGSAGTPQRERALMSTRADGWATAELWGWTRNGRLTAAAVSGNGRAVAIRVIDNLRGRTVAVEMRVFRPR
jgi:hypothetical protein